MLKTAPVAERRPDLARRQAIYCDCPQDLSTRGRHRHLRVVELERSAVLVDRPSGVSELEMQSSHPLEPVAAQAALDLVRVFVIDHLAESAEERGAVLEDSVRVSGPLLIDGAVILRERHPVRSFQMPAPDLVQPLTAEATLDLPA